MLAAADGLIGCQFLFNSGFIRRTGDSFRNALCFNTLSYLAACVLLFIVNGFRFEFTLFTFLMSLWSAANGLVLTFCSAKALMKIDLSLYSVFMMLGGMAVPFAGGLLFFGEKLTLGKALCFAATAAALFLTVGKGEKKGGWYWYAGLFTLNGMNGIISKIFTDSSQPKASAAGYSLLTSIIILCVSAAALFITRRPRINGLKRSFYFAFGHGVCSSGANLLILKALVGLPASAQYPFITGGSMIVSTLIGFLTPQKPNRREVISVVVSFAGILALLLL